LLYFFCREKWNKPQKMSKEFEGLVQHISVLEAAQREQEAKLAAEIVKHNNTKAELQKGTPLLATSLSEAVTNSCRCASHQARRPMEAKGHGATDHLRLSQGGAERRGTVQPAGERRGAAPEARELQDPRGHQEGHRLHEA